jgi:hypothetical protein
MIEIQAPNPIPDNGIGPTIFLGGSIEMGAAEDWQDRIIRELSDTNYTFLNPRRKDWDSSWVQSIDNPQFKEQVEWELNAQKEADGILYYFDPNTKAPITLLELGLFAASDKVLVICPEGFWRKGNVDIVCNEYGIMQLDSIDELISKLRQSDTDLKESIRKFINHD